MSEELAYGEQATAAHTVQAGARVRRVGDPVYYGKWLTYKVTAVDGARAKIMVLAPPGRLKPWEEPTQGPFWVDVANIEEVGPEYPYEAL